MGMKVEEGKGLVWKQYCGRGKEEGKRFVPILLGLLTTASKRRSARLLYSLPPNDDELPYYPKQHRALPCL